MAALLLLAPSAPASITPAAKKVLDRHVEATGGRKAREGIRSLYVHGTIGAFGMTGSVRSWHLRPLSRAAEIEIGPLRLSDGCDGTTAWRFDPSGKLVMLDGVDLVDARSQAWFENDRWLEPDQGGGTITDVGSERDSAGTYRVLEVTAPASAGAAGAPKPRRLWFDDKTGLLVRSISKRDQHTATVFSSDYRAVQGRKMAFQSLTRIEGMPANDVRLTIDSVSVNPEIPAARFRPPAAQASAVRWLKTKGVARLPFEYASRHVWLRASVNGAPPADFIFDTGASRTVLDSAYAARIGVATTGRQQGMGAGAVGGASFATLGTMRVAAPDSDGVEVADLAIAVLDLNRFLAPYFWRDVAGVIGFDFIQRFVDEIDFDQRRLVLHDPATFQYRGQGTAIPITIAGTTPVVKLRLDGTTEGLARVDVGSGSSLDLHVPFVKQQGLLERPGPSLEVTGGGFGGQFKSVARRMEKLEIGPFAVARPVVLLSRATSGAFTSEDYAGNLGTRVLDRFVCTFDYERRVLYLEPGRRYQEPEVFPRAGFELARFGDRVQAFGVQPGAPATKAGLREEDVVTTLDGRPVLEWTPDRIAEALERGPVGSRHVLEVERSGKRVRIEFELKDLL